MLVVNTGCVYIRQGLDQSFKRFEICPAVYPKLLRCRIMVDVTFIDEALRFHVPWDERTTGDIIDELSKTLPAPSNQNICLFLACIACSD